MVNHGRLCLFLEIFLPRDQECSRENSVASSASSTSDDLTRITRDTWYESENIPYIVEPGEAEIPPEEEASFKVTFAPEDEFYYAATLKSNIVNLHPALTHVSIPLRAKGVTPLYHLDLPPSSYFERRGGKSVCEDYLDENTKVVEFEAIGLGIPVVR